MTNTTREKLDLALALLDCAEFRERIGLRDREPVPIRVLAATAGVSERTIRRMEAALLVKARLAAAETEMEGAA